MFGLGSIEVIVILIIALVIFGSRLPSVARSLGRSLTEFKKGVNGVRDEIEEAGEPKKIESDDAPQEKKAAASVSDDDE